MVKNREAVPIDLVTGDMRGKPPVFEIAHLVNEDITFAEFKKLEWLEFVLFGDNYDSYDEA